MSKIGIDIIGFPRGKLGIGEQSRSLARVALAAGYQINFIDCFHESDNLKNDDSEFDAFITKKFCYPLRIYSLTQPHIGALVYRFGINFFMNKHNIFHLAWEFEKRPSYLDDVLRFADEIWGISSFTARCFANDLGIPVQTMPNALPPLKGYGNATRADFDLPINKFLFYSTFDINSTISRKNPMASIMAFKQAFDNNEDVGLVLKASNVKKDFPAWKELESLISSDNRICLVTQTLPREMLTNLCMCCDAYVSLHRSEGFGLGLIEAFNLKKPVVCTSFSGNMDFCSDDTAYLVDYEIVPVQSDEYPYSDGLVWANPSISCAANQMREVYFNSNVRERKVCAAYDLSKNFSARSLAPRFSSLVTNFLKRM